MIILTRLGCGLPIAVNPDLIERAEHTPDTVVTLIDGHKLVVEEPVEDIVALIRAWRASIAAEAIALARMAATDAPHTSRLASVRAGDGELDRSVLADQSAHGSPLGQVLHLPSREA